MNPGTGVTLPDAKTVKWSLGLSQTVRIASRRPCHLKCVKTFTATFYKTIASSRPTTFKPEHCSHH